MSKADARARNDRLRDKLRELLADGQYHDREKLIQECSTLIHTDDALEYALMYDYQTARRWYKRFRSSAEFAIWLREHPDMEHYTPTKNGTDPDFGRRQIVMALLAHDDQFITIRQNTNGSGRALVRLRGGEAASIRE